MKDVKLMVFGILFQIRQSIDGLLNQMKELPARLRAYASYEHVKRMLQMYAKVGLISLENFIFRQDKLLKKLRKSLFLSFSLFS